LKGFLEAAFKKRPNILRAGHFLKAASRNPFKGDGVILALRARIVNTLSSVLSVFSVVKKVTIFPCHDVPPSLR